MHISLTGETMPKGKNTSTRAFRVRSSGLLVAWLCLLPGQAAGQAAGQSPPTLPASPQGDLTTVSLEDLMNIEVTSVSKKGQKLSRTAAAVFVITQEDIQRSGATNIPDLLRMVPGCRWRKSTGTTGPLRRGDSTGSTPTNCWS